MAGWGILLPDSWIFSVCPAIQAIGSTSHLPKIVLNPNIAKDAAAANMMQTSSTFPMPMSLFATEYDKWTVQSDPFTGSERVTSRRGC
jgi:hypothetical protein